MFNYDRRQEHNKQPEVISDLHMTVPGMALDIGTAVARHQQGMEIRTYVPQYIDSDELDAKTIADFEKMDRVERLQWAAQERQRLRNLAQSAFVQGPSRPPAENPLLNSSADEGSKTPDGGTEEG